MNSTLLLLWAKKERGTSNNTESFHPLICHAIDTISVVLYLWDEVLSEAQKRNFISILGVDARNILALLAGLHDTGKILPGFIAQWPKLEAVLKQAGLDFSDVPKILHGVVTGDRLFVRLKELGCHNISALQIAYTIGGHHGIIPRLDEKPVKDQLGNAKWEDIRRELFDELVRLLNVEILPERISKLGKDKGLLTKLAGLTSVADWIASDENSFPYAMDSFNKEISYLEYFHTSQERAWESLGKIGWTGWRPQQITKSFKDLFGFDSLRSLQQKTVELAEQNLKEPSIVLIEAPMGEGKTETAFYLADWLQAVAGQRGMYVALPTQATSNQMFQRTIRFLSQRYPGEKVNLHLLHGQAILMDDYQQLVHAAMNDIDGEEDESLVAAEWFLPKKRALLAPFGVGTIDQALTGVLQVRHNFVRLYGLADKVVIFDEVHAYDTYMSKLLDRLIEWLSFLGSSVILLSATLPERRRNELIKAYIGKENPLGKLEGRYPRITWAVKSIQQPDCIEIEPPKSKRIILTHLNDNHENIVADLVSLMDTCGGCAAWICNTVGRAQSIYGSLKALLVQKGLQGEIGIDILHARYPFETRQAKEKSVIEHFGKASLKDKLAPEYRPRPGKFILIATQIIEQSLDLDFDLMITDLAPVDLFLQRLGRLWRHERPERPKGLSSPVVWLVEPGQSSNGVPTFESFKGIYTEYVLFRSWLTLKDDDQIMIPDGIEDLIEKTYGDRLDFTTLPQKYQDALIEMKKKEDSLERRHIFEAENRMIQTPFDEETYFIDLRNAGLKEDDPESHPAIQAATRMGKPSVGIICLYEQPEGWVSLDKDGKLLVNLDAEPDLELAKGLLNRAVQISQPIFYKYFTGQEAPKGWRHSSLLRYHRAAVFKNEVIFFGGWEMRLDEELGIVFIKDQEVNKED